MYCPQCFTPGIRGRTPCDPRVTEDFVSLVPSHRSPTGHLHEEAYQREVECKRCRRDLWTPAYWPGGGDQRSWFCVPCSRAASAYAYSRKAGTPAQRAARAERKRQTRAQAALTVLRASIPSLPPSVAELAEIERLRQENARLNQFGGPAS